MKSLILSLAVIFSSAFASAKPQFPTLPKSNLDLSKIEASLQGSMNYYCKQQSKIADLQSQATEQELKAQLQGEANLLSAVCENGQLVGIKDPSIDKNANVLVKFELAFLGLIRFVTYYQSLGSNVPNTIYVAWTDLRDYDNMAMPTVYEKAYNKNGNVDTSSLRSQIRNWATSLFESYKHN